jgi:CubicO group peptidase (beta-lactamase class C family)
VRTDSTYNAQLDPDAFATADGIVSDFFDRGGQPAIAYGIVAGGELVHSGGIGCRALGGDRRPAPAPAPDPAPAPAPAPDARTVFRIASMSKSFTASALLLLRDAGALSLDDPAEAYVPELAGWSYGSADADPVTIRQLLTMTAGFPTDDPWGDRQQGLPIAEFDARLAAGVSFNWAPGTRFEYSNLGYAILGRVLTAAAGVPYDEFIRTRLLVPLGMSRTGFEASEFDDVDLALGYRHAPGGWEEVPFDPYGAFTPMGGIYSCVCDLARWVAGFAAAFPPDGDSAAVPHPLRAASRRQMQLAQAVTGWQPVRQIPGAALASPAYYGFGLFVDEDPDLGRVVGHSGGYPGFGSNMRWHPATGVGFIALANGTYAPMTGLTGLVLKALVAPRPAVYQLALAPAARARDTGQPWPETLAAAEAVSALIKSWDDAAADELFSENVALDAPYRERRRSIEVIRERIGEFGADGTRPAESDTPAHRRWWLAGDRGAVQAQIQLSPERPPRVMSLALAVPPAPDSALARALAAVVAWLNSGAGTWPESLPVAAAADAGLIARRLRMAAAWLGTVTAGGYRTGNGSTSVGVDLIGEHATGTLSLLINATTGELRQADVTL